MSESIGDNLEAKFKGALTDSLLAILVSLVRPIATLTEIIFRKDMGERYFNGWNIVVGLLAIIVFRSPFWSNHRGIYQTITNIIAVVWVIALLVYAYLNRQRIIERYGKSHRWHSYNYGIPRYEELPVVVEKALPIAVGLLLVLVCGITGMGGLLFFSGVISLFLRNYEARLFYERMLDQIDSQIEHDNLNKAVVEQFPPQQTEGLVAHVPRYVGKELRSQLVRPRGLTPENKPPEEKQ